MQIYSAFGYCKKFFFYHRCPIEGERKVGLQRLYGSESGAIFERLRRQDALFRELQDISYQFKTADVYRAAEFLGGSNNSHDIFFALVEESGNFNAARIIGKQEYARP